MPARTGIKWMYRTSASRYSSTSTNQAPAALEEVSGGAQPILVPTSVGACDALHHSTERSIGHLPKQMQVIAHPAIGVQSRAEVRHNFTDDRGEPLAIATLVEDALPVVAPQHNMINPSRHVQSATARHPCPLHFWPADRRTRRSDP
jgi:hypothetical protein